MDKTLEQSGKWFLDLFRWAAIILVMFSIGMGCINPAPQPTLTQSDSPELVITPALASSPAIEPALVGKSVVVDIPELPMRKGLLYGEDFTDPSSGWPNELVFDNYYVGYHEPDYYHVEVHQPLDSTLVVLPQRDFGDATVETEAFVSEANTAPDGDFRYGLVVRRSGKQFYAFTISPRTKIWSVLKGSPSGLEVLEENAEPSIQGLEMADVLRVDAKGSDFKFHINGNTVSQISDPDYGSGEIGFFVETFDGPRAHIHYDWLIIQNVEAGLLSRPGILYGDDFTDSTSGWPNELVFDNYYVGYHEPEYYHVEVHQPLDNTLVVLPQRNFGDATVETEVFVSEANTAPDGDFRYGLVARRSGKQFYAFTISPRTKIWSVLKGSPLGLEVLEENTEPSIQGLEMADVLRVDAKGSDFKFHINGNTVSQISDPDYGSGEIGFFVETFDGPRAHIHYDWLAIREFEGDS